MSCRPIIVITILLLAGNQPIRAAAGACNCPHQGDFDTNGCSDVFDVLAVCKIAFKGGADTRDPECPKTRGDVNNSGETDILDVTYIIKTAFANGPNPVNPCALTEADLAGGGATEPPVLWPAPASDRPVTLPQASGQTSIRDASLTNQVVVESKHVTLGATGVVIGIKITNSVTLAAIVLPLTIRSITPGTFITALTASATSVRNPADRLSLTSGTGALQQMRYTNRYGTEDGNCKEGQPGGFKTPVDTTYIGPWNSPGGVLMVCGEFVPDSYLLPPGIDTTVAGALRLTVSVNSVAGSFEIDTTCTDPCNHLTFVEGGTNLAFLPAFTKGVINVSGNGIEHPPVARDTAWATNQDTPKDVAYLPASDPDSGEFLTYAILSGPAHGSTSGFNSATGALTYTPAAGYTGLDSLRFTACDDGWPSMCDTGIVQITVLHGTVVANLDDSGLGSLRATIAYANRHPGPDSIRFDVAGTIRLLSPLPPLSDLSGGTTILGFSAPGAQSPIISTVILDGSSCSPGPGLDVRTYRNWIEGLTISGFQGPGISIPPELLAEEAPLDIPQPAVDWEELTQVANRPRGEETTGRPSPSRVSRTLTACNCPYPGDVNGDDAFDIFDILFTVERAFQDYSCSKDPECPVERCDFNADSIVDAMDVAQGIDYGFGFGPPPKDPCTGLSSQALPVSGGSVVVESKSVPPKSTGVAVGVKVSNAVPLRLLVIPLQIREITPGAFITSLKMTYSDRLTGLASFQAQRNQYASADGSCKQNLSGGYSTITFSGGGSHPVAASPTGLMFTWCKDLNGSSLSSGFDATGSLVLTIDVTETEGTFEIDTTCTNPGNHLIFIQDDPNVNTPILPSFTKGVITIEKPSGNTFSANCIYRNSGPGIDLGNDGITLNDPGDADTGPNTLLNYPVFDSVRESSKDIFSVFGSSTPNSHVELFLAAESGNPSYQPEATNHGPAYAFLATTIADGNGRFRIDSVGKPEWSSVTATATDLQGNTSEFSENRQLTNPVQITGYSEPLPPARRVSSMPDASPAIKVVVFSPPNSLGQIDSIGPTFNTFGPLARYDSLTDYNGGGLADTRVTVASPDTGLYRIQYVLTGNPGDYLTGVSISGHVELGSSITFVSVGQVIDTTYHLAPPTRGDLNGDGVIDVFDVIASIDIIFSGAPPPSPPELVDVNCDGVPDVFDVIYLIDYAFSGGAEPCH